MSPLHQGISSQRRLCVARGVEGCQYDPYLQLPSQANLPKLYRVSFTDPGGMKD